MKKKKGWIVVLVILIVVLLAVGGYILFLSKPGATVEGSAYVQSVAEITGVGYAGLSNSYSGVVEAKEVVEVNPDSSLTIKECFVSAGDEIKVGDKLFCYDVDELTLQHEQLLIDITGLEGTITTAKEQIEKLDKRIAKAKEADLYELKLEKQTVELTLKKSGYELADKKEKADRMQEIILDSTVLSPIDGKIRSVRTSDSEQNPYGGMDNGQSNAYITIVAGNDYCIKGKVSEQTVRSLYEGMAVTVRSREDRNAVYAGEIYKINTTEAESDSQGMYYGGDMGEKSSKYAFYVSIDDIEGLIIGQHVFIELGSNDSDDDTWKLPSYYILNEGDKHWVYAADKNGIIEKREITLGDYDENLDSYAVTAGLALEDKLAYPDETVKVGMKASETQYVPEDNGQNMPKDGPIEVPIAGDSSFGG